jgi:hypothetical protein
MFWGNLYDESGLKNSSKVIKGTASTFIIILTHFSDGSGFRVIPEFPAWWFRSNVVVPVCVPG